MLAWLLYLAAGAGCLATTIYAVVLWRRPMDAYPERDDFSDNRSFQAALARHGYRRALPWLLPVLVYTFALFVWTIVTL